MDELIIESVGDERQHRGRLRKLLQHSDGPVRISSPYITETDLLSDLDSRSVKLLTSTTPDDLSEGASSLATLSEILESKVQCRFFPRPTLHAKVYIFGEESAVVSSANFTKKAFNQNIEVGCVLRGTPVIRLTEWFDSLWALGIELNSKQLEEIQDQVEARRFWLAVQKPLGPSVPSWKNSICTDRVAFWSQVLELSMERSVLHSHSESQSKTGTFIRWKSGVPPWVKFQFVIGERHDWWRVEVYIDNEDSQAFNQKVFDMLKAKETQLEDQFGGKLEWDPKGRKKDSRAFLIKYDEKVEEGEIFSPQQIEAIVDAMWRLENTFAPHLKSIADSLGKR
ncbi:MAG: DUF4268 domain-containing protein [Pirellulaceae bacterium]